MAPKRRAVCEGWGKRQLYFHRQHAIQYLDFALLTSNFPVERLGRAL